jgi:beta-glucanase (GH16 family)
MPTSRHLVPDSWWIVLILVWGGLFGGVSARGAIVIGNVAAYTNDGTVTTIKSSGVPGAAFGFTMGTTNYTLTDVVVRLNLGTLTTNVPLVQLYQGGSLATGTLATTFTIATLPSTNTYSALTFLPTVPVQLTAGQSYYLVITPQGSSAIVLWSGGSPSVTPTGTAATVAGAVTGTTGQTNPTSWTTPSSTYNWFQVDGAVGTLQTTFSDNFSTGSLDPTKWTPNYPFPGTINNELEAYLPYNFQFPSGGGLQIVARKQSFTDTENNSFNYTSGAMTTFATFNQAYGYFQIVAQLPKGNGFWPAFWLLPVGPVGSEIDVFESLGQDPTTVYLTLHYLNASGQETGTGVAYTGPDYSAGYHTFAISWRPGLLVFLVDGVPRQTITGTNVPAGPEYLLANLAIGGDWVGLLPPDATTPFPSTYNIQSIKAYQYNDSPAVTPAPITFGPTTLNSFNVSPGGKLVVQSSITAGAAALTTPLVRMYVNDFLGDFPQYTEIDQNLPTVAAGASKSFSTTYTVPTNFAGGLYTIGYNLSWGTSSSTFVGCVTHFAVQTAPSFTNPALGATVAYGAAYSFSFQTAGYPVPTYAVTSGSLPPGLTLSSAGVLTGTPTQSGTYSGTVTATNGIGTAATQNFTITVAANAPTLPPWGLALLAGFLLLATYRAVPPGNRRGEV